MDDFDHVPDDWDEMDDLAQQKFLDEEAETWLWENVDVFAEVVDE